LIVEQIYHIGLRSISIVFVAALATGAVMSLQFGLGMEKFGAKLYVPKIVALSFAKELGPIFTALMMAGRVGAGIASELGSMTVTQQIDAIRALGTSPIKRVVIPRIIACIISVPLLTVMANAIGMIGAAIVGSTTLGLDTGFFFSKVYSTVRYFDYASGILKTFFFAFFIGITACYYGMNVKEGTRGVGIATTKAVVTSSILILISDFFLSKLLWVVEKWIL
jgi:phospholipid/cholesterol/gamma-HCH transport system permease protein